MTLENKNVKIDFFDKSNLSHVKEAARLLADCFPQAYKDCSRAEMDAILNDERIAVMAVIDNRLIGFIGAIPQYGITGWELHPLVVNPAYRNMGVGSRLVDKLEKEVLSRVAS